MGQGRDRVAEVKANPLQEEMAPDWWGYGEYGAWSTYEGGYGPGQLRLYIAICVRGTTFRVELDASAIARLQEACKAAMLGRRHGTGRSLWTQVWHPNSLPEACLGDMEGVPEK